MLINARRACWASASRPLATDDFRVTLDDLRSHGTPSCARIAAAIAKKCSHSSQAGVMRLPQSVVIVDRQTNQQRSISQIGASDAELSNVQRKQPLLMMHPSPISTDQFRADFG